MNLSTAQRILRFFTSAATFEKMKADSHTWKFDCNECGKTSSIWDIGGIRYKAIGEPYSGVRCPHCGKFKMRKIYKEATV